MSDITITSSGTASSYTLSQPLPLTNASNIVLQGVDFLNNNGTNAGVLILTDNAQGSAFTITTTSLAGGVNSYSASLGGSITNFQPVAFGVGGDQITIQAVTDLFAELFPAGTANPDYISLVDDVNTAARSGDQFLILPDGSIALTPGTHFTLDAAQKQVIAEVGAALFGTAAAADGATLDLAFGLRTNPKSDVPFIDALITTDVTVNPCFAAGTRLLTTRGEVAVEALKIGDVLITHAGEEQAVQWIGRREVEISAHPRPETVRPVVIEPGALGEHMPVRRLVLSPDHALLLDGVLVPAKALLNWTSIRQDITARGVTYLHVELERHDVVLAEGTPAESYLDTGHRGIFDNGGAEVVAHPALMQRRREAESCAPLCLDGPRLAAIRQRLAAKQVGVRLG